MRCRPFLCHQREVDARQRQVDRLIVDAIGIDIDAVACAITRFELRADRMPDLGSFLVDPVGTALVDEWIRTTPACP